MSTNGKAVHQHVIKSGSVTNAAIDVCQWLDEYEATLICVSQVAIGDGVTSTIFYTPK